MTFQEAAPLFFTVLGFIVASSSLYATVVVTRYRGRYEALESSLNLMSLSNTELRAENDRQKTTILEIKARLDVIQSELVRSIVDEIAAAAAAAVTAMVEDAREHIRGTR